MMTKSDKAHLSERLLELVSPSPAFEGDHTAAEQDVVQEAFLALLENKKMSGARPDLRPVVVFLDDDELFIAGLRPHIRKYAEEWDIKVFTNAEEALRELKYLREAIVVTDWMMPGVDGVGLCEQLRIWQLARGYGPYYTILLTGREHEDSAVVALERGADDFIRKPTPLSEVFSRVRVGIRQVEERKALLRDNAVLSERAMIDYLTGVCNRASTEELLRRELDRTARGLQQMGLLMIDVDHFKNINDRFGHTLGDEVLSAIAQGVASAVRQYDTVGRWGGDEFVVICPNCPQKRLVQIAERVRKSANATSAPLAIEGCEVSISVGTAHVTEGSTLAPLDLVRLADRALYAAKRAGRNRVE